MLLSHVSVSQNRFLYSECIRTLLVHIKIFFFTISRVNQNPKKILYPGQLLDYLPHSIYSFFPPSFFVILFIYFLKIDFNWRLITLQYCGGFG